MTDSIESSGVEFWCEMPEQVIAMSNYNGKLYVKPVSGAIYDITEQGKPSLVNTGAIYTDCGI